MMRLTRISAIGGLLLALGAAAPAGARGQDVAFLLGQRDRTTLIVVHGDSVVARRGPGLVVPRASGWWRVGVDMPGVEHPDTTTVPDTASESEGLPPREMNMHGEELGHPACFGHFVWAAPLGRMPTPPDSLCAEDEERAGEYAFTFVSPAILTMYAGITTDYSYNFARGTIVSTLDSVARVPLTDMHTRSWAEDEVDPAPALGVPAGDAAWEREAVRCNVEYNRGIREENDDSTAYDYVGTWIVRTPGRWRYERYYANTSYVGRGSESSCVVRLPVPARLTGWDRLTVPWSAIRRRVPGAMDAFTSPNGAVAIVLDSTSARVFRIEKNALGAELATIPGDPSLIPSVENTTMSQWATGGASRRWEAELAGVLPVVVEVRKGGAGKR